jgi:hypothetical protein
LTYAPSLMAHVYRHDAAATNSRNDIGKDWLKEYCMRLFSWLFNYIVVS